jgi:seryl-tRNA synthetase
LLEKHEVSLERLNEVQRASDASSQTVSTLQEHIKRLQRELGQSTVQVQLSKQTASKKLQTFKEQLNLSRPMLWEKQDAIDRRQPKLEFFCLVVVVVGGGDTDRYRQELNVIMTAIRRYSLAQCILNTVKVHIRSNSRWTCRHHQKSRRRPIRIRIKINP